MNRIVKRFLLGTLPFFLLANSLSAEEIKRTPKVGLVLSGGGAKGIAHLEILKALEKAGVKIDYIAGTSMGAIVGGLYASGLSTDEIEETVNEIDFNNLFINDKDRTEKKFFDKSYKEKYLLQMPFDNFQLNIPSAISKGQGPMSLLTTKLSGVHNITNHSRLPIPFFCIATNIETGKEKILEKGFLPLNILASASYPSLISPVKIKDSLYIDGGLVNNFPAKELKNKGMDIIIGVDVGSGLYKQDELNSLVKILDQMISFKIIDKTEEQKKYVDILVKPNLEDFTVTDFQAKDSILSIGKKEASIHFSKFQEIAKKQGNIKEEVVQSTPILDYIIVNKIKILGNKDYSEKSILKKLGLKAPLMIKREDLDKKINSLYSSNDYNNVYYRIDKDYETLEIIVSEKTSDQLLKFGLHYDDTFKTGLLANITLPHLFKTNTTLSTDVVFGDNFRANANFFIDNGLKPSFGYNISHKSLNFNYKNIKDSEIGVSEISDFNQQLYIQSTLNEKYAIGLGLEHTYVSTRIKDNGKTKAFYINPYSYIRIDTQNNPNFPSRGLKLNLEARYHMISNYTDFDPFLGVKADASYSVRLSRKFFIENNAYVGLNFFTNNIPDIYKQNMGGYTGQYLYNFKAFIGVPIAFRSSNNMISFDTNLNYRIQRNHYLKASFAIANLEEKIEDFNYLNYKYTAVGLGYGYDSPLGPINLKYSYSPQYKKGFFSVALGYWF